MERNERDQFIIEQYQNDEAMMVVIFAQWCVNNKYDARELYKRAYPDQVENKALLEALDNTVPKEQADDITYDVVQQVLQLFGNDDLAFVIDQAVNERKK